MNPGNVHGSESTPDHAPALVVRQAISSMNSLDVETANHLKALAFVLMRVARADGRVCNDERLQMEEILVDHARISAEHAVLVTEIARHRAQLADCAKAYAISRQMRAEVEDARRTSIVGLLLAVAKADSRFSAVERREIVQIAGELGIDPTEVLNRG
jgi:uncharacterized tellurite resistance protein B-like protein